MKKPVFYTEAAYFIGLFLLALGTALTAYGGFGISMVVAQCKKEQTDKIGCLCIENSFFHKYLL